MKWNGEFHETINHINSKATMTNSVTTNDRLQNLLGNFFYGNPHVTTNTLLLIKHL